MKTHKMPTKQISFLPLPKTANVPKPFFSLFEKKADGSYVRISDNQYYNERVAYHIFADRIVKAPLSLTIRPIKLEKPKVGKFKGVSYSELRDSPLRERVSK